jgi:hypothetical protein
MNHYILERYAAAVVSFLAPVFQTKDKKETWHAVVRQLTCVMRKRRGRNTRISFPTQKKREKGHNNNQGRNYIVSFFLS